MAINRTRCALAPSPTSASRIGPLPTSRCSTYLFAPRRKHGGGVPSCASKKHRMATRLRRRNSTEKFSLRIAAENGCGLTWSGRPRYGGVSPAAPLTRQVRAATGPSILPLRREDRRERATAFRCFLHRPQRASRRNARCPADTPAGHPEYDGPLPVSLNKPR